LEKKGPGLGKVQVASEVIVRSLLVMGSELGGSKASGEKG